MKAKTTASILFLFIGSVMFSVGHTQASSDTNTAQVASNGTLTSQNPSNWISAVSYQSSEGIGSGGVYQLTFRDAAPSASSCTATPKNSSLTGLVEAPAAMPNELLVSFRQYSSSGGVVTPMPSSFTLTCSN